MIYGTIRFRNQIPKLDREVRLGLLIQQITNPDINLGPARTASQPGLDNHAVGTIFEELIRRLNEENNEEAGERFTPRSKMIDAGMPDAAAQRGRDRQARCARRGAATVRRHGRRQSCPDGEPVDDAPHGAEK